MYVLFLLFSGCVPEASEKFSASAGTGYKRTPPVIQILVKSSFPQRSTGGKLKWIPGASLSCSSAETGAAGNSRVLQGRTNHTSGFLAREAGGAGSFGSSRERKDLCGAQQRGKPLGLIRARMDQPRMTPGREEAGGREPPDGPVLCKNGCGFFGSASTMDMCSLCYKAYVKEEVAAGSKAASAAAVAEGFASEAGADSHSATATAEPATGVVSQPEPPKPGRCAQCNKRVGYTGLRCRCGNTYCSLHRPSNQHSCTVDYKAAGQVAIAKANPVIKADKVDRI